MVLWVRHMLPGRPTSVVLAAAKPQTFTVDRPACRQGCSIEASYYIVVSVEGNVSHLAAMTETY